MNEELDNIEVLETLIIGRIKPHIYAFKTNTVPNYLKIGDTCRPVKTRLNERRKHFEDLEKTFDEEATVDDNNFFRDYSIHKYILEDLGKERLEYDENLGFYYSNEFFKDVENEDIEQAINDIKSDFINHGDKYTFYDLNTSIRQNFYYERSENEWPLRPNQETAVNNFINAVDNGRNNLLMYAVMRFGKSFTSMMCAKEKEAKLIVVVSAKADVKQEWKKTVEEPKNFENFYFYDSSDLERNENLITESLNTNQTIVIFLTLQDLQGDFIKEKHEDLFTHEIDLLIVDETHFGARGDEYGKILKDQNVKIKDIVDSSDDDSIKESDDINESIDKVLRRKVTLHLSGTPYKILMGSEFSNEDVICFCQFSDIIDAQKKWDEDHLDDPEYNEWDNPYFGFPQMIRFAFNPSRQAREKLDALKKEGCSYAFYALLKPKSIKKADDGSHKIFENEEEVLELLEVIDGSKQDENVLGFLDYDKIKEGNMCRHIVMVLPYCASCDAMEALINTNRDNFKNLKDYEIINISGIDNPRRYSSTNEVKNKIKECEDNNKKTITLTVNRMLTGSTVEQRDTMIYLKDTASPQEYDQAIFRLQNQYVKTIGEGDDIIKYNMKPQTLLVDFDPDRMFRLQEQKSQIYNFNTDEGGNSRLNERLQKELQISPIITLNSNMIQQVESTDILKAVSKYHMDRGIKEEALEIPVDLKILNDSEIMAIISRENEIDSKEGISISAVEGSGNGDDLDIPDTPNDNPQIETGIGDDNGAEQGDDEDNSNTLKKKLQSFYTRILLYAFLVDERVISLSDIINSIEGNSRVAANIGLNRTILDKFYNYYHTYNKQILSSLDYKIQNLNELSHNSELTPEKKAQVVLKKFGKLGVATVVTPIETCKEMIDLIPDEKFLSVNDTHKIIDITGVAGEFAVAIHDKMTRLNIDANTINNSIYSITKSSICYELTRKVYEMLGLNINNIATFYSEDLINIKNENHEVDYERIGKILSQNKNFSEIQLYDDLSTQTENNMIKFNAIVGNPPYQSSAERTEDQTQENSSWIYYHFQNIADELGEISCLIYPFGGWFDSPTKYGGFGNNILTDGHTISVNAYEGTTDKRARYRTDRGPEPIFGNTANLSAGVSIVLRDNGTHDNFLFSNRVYNDEVVEIGSEDIEFISPNPIFININKKLTGPKLNNRIKKGIFGIESNFVERNPDRVSDRKEDWENPIILYTNDKSGSSGRAVKYWTTLETLEKGHEYVDSFKIIMPSAYPKKTIVSSTSTIDNVKRRIDEVVERLPAKSAFGRSKLALFMSENEEECDNFMKYMHTNFFTGLTLQEPNRSSSFGYIIPDQDFTNDSDIDWSQSIEDIDRQLFEKYHLTEEEINVIKGN